MVTISDTGQEARPRRVTLPDLERAVVAGALSDATILEQIKVRHSERLTGRLRALFNAATAYYDIARGTMPREALESILIANEPDQAKHTEYTALYDSLTGPPFTSYTIENWRWILHQFDTEWQVNETGTILAEAAEAMQSGHQAHGRTYAGAEAAWQLLSQRRVDYERLSRGSVHTEAEFTATTNQAKQEYQHAVESKYTGCPLALTECLNATNGLRAGDLLIVSGYASEGKSFILMNDAHAAWRVGNNVVFASGEMGVPKMRRRFIALHSKTLADEGKVELPLETTKLDRGLLTREEHEVFLTVLEDIKTNPEYGKFFTFKFPFGATPTLIYNRIAAFDQIVPITAGYMDYLGLLTSDKPYPSRREQLDDVLRQTKALAMDFGGGRGLACEAGFQVNRTSYERALERGYYDLTAFAECSEVEKSADAAMWILLIPQSPAEVKAGFMKNRDDEKGDPFFIAKNYKWGQVRSLRSKPTGGTKQQSAADLLNI